MPCFSTIHYVRVCSGLDAPSLGLFFYFFIFFPRERVASVSHKLTSLSIFAQAAHEGSGGGGGLVGLGQHSAAE